MWGLGHTIVPHGGESPIESKFNFFNMCSTIHCKKKKKISQGWGWGNGGGKATAVMPHGGGGGGGGAGGGGGGGGKVTGQWTIPPLRPRWGGGGGGGGLSLIGA